MIAVRALPRLVWSRFIWIVLCGETLVARGILAGIAALWAGMLWLPGDTFERPVYAIMVTIAPETPWAIAWTLYALLGAWRLFANSTRAWVAFSVNGFGLVLYGTAAACIVFSKVWPAPAATAGDIGLSLVAIWVFMRSGIHDGGTPGWRDD